MDGESKVRQINRVARYLEVRDARLAEAEVFREADRQAQRWMDRFDMFAAAALQALVGSQEFADRCNADPQYIDPLYTPEDQADVWVVGRAKAIALEMVMSSEGIYINAYDDVAFDCMMKEERNVQQES
jgi:hypothetical protein